MATSALGAGRGLMPFWAAASYARNITATSALGAGRGLRPFWAATFSKILPEAENLNAAVKKSAILHKASVAVSGFSFWKKNYFCAFDAEGSCVAITFRNPVLGTRTFSHSSKPSFRYTNFFARVMLC